MISGHHVHLCSEPQTCPQNATAGAESLWASESRSAPVLRRLRQNREERDSRLRASTMIITQAICGEKSSELHIWFTKDDFAFNVSSYNKSGPLWSLITCCITRGAVYKIFHQTFTRSFTLLGISTQNEALWNTQTTVHNRTHLVSHTLNQICVVIDSSNHTY